MKRRSLIIAFGAGAIAESLRSFAQQPAKAVRLGFLSTASANSPGWVARVEALRAGLKDLGYIEGKNLHIEFRWAEDRYERLPELAAELVRLKVDVIITHATPAALAIKRTPSEIPVVMAVSTEPVSGGLAASLARPGGRFTGSTFFNTELAAKRLELVRDVLPKAARIALVTNPAHPDESKFLATTRPAAQALKLQMQNFAVRGPDELEGVLTEVVKQRFDALVLIDEPMLNANARKAAEIALRLRLRAFGPPEFGEGGGLIGFGVNFPELFRRSAFFIDKIARGAKPGDIPFERPTKFELIVNLKTAQALGVTLSEQFLVRADKVIS